MLVFHRSWRRVDTKILGQSVDGVGGEAGLDEELGGEDGDHLLSASNEMLLGRRALRH